MQYLTTILQVPILQIFGLLLVVAFAERIGIPVVSIFLKFLKLNGNGKDNEWQKQMSEQVGLLSTNHIHEVKQAIENMDERMKIRDEGLKEVMKEIRETLTEINRNCFK